MRTLLMMMHLELLSSSNGFCRTQFLPSLTCDSCTEQRIENRLANRTVNSIMPSLQQSETLRKIALATLFIIFIVVICNWNNRPSEVTVFAEVLDEVLDENLISTTNSTVLESSEVRNVTILNK